MTSNLESRGVITELRIRRRFLLLTALRWFPGGLTLPVLVLLMQSRNISLSQVGILFAVFTVLTAVWELPTGVLADTLGRKNILLASSVLTVAAFVTFCFSKSFTGFCVGFSIFSAGRALSSGPLQSWYVDSVSALQPPPDIRTGLSREGLVSSLSIGSAAMLGGSLPNVARSVFPDLPVGGSPVFSSLTAPVWLAAVLLALSTLAIFLIMDSDGRSLPDGRDSAPGRVGPVATLRMGIVIAGGNSDLRAILVAGAAVGMAMSATEIMAPSYIESVLGSAGQATSIYGALVTVSFVAGGLGSSAAPLIGRLARGSMRGSAISVLLGAVAYALLGLFGGVVVMVAAYLVIYLAVGASEPLHSEQIHYRVAASHRTTVLSIVSMAMMAGAAVGAVAVGYVVNHMGYSAGWYLCTGSLLVAAALSWGVRSLKIAERHE